MRGLRALACAAGGLSLVAAVVGITKPADAETEFTFGGGFAQASLLVPALNAGELSVPIVMGESAAGYQDETGRAISTVFAIPLLSATGSNGRTCGIPTGSAVPLPAPLSADTSSKQNKGNVDKSKTQGPVEQEVHAKPRSSGETRTQFENFGMPNLVTIGGATAKASTVADATKQTRRVHATTTVADLQVFGGLVKFTGLRWELSQAKDGADSRTSKPVVTKAFRFDGIVIDPAASAVPLPLPIPKVKIPLAAPGGAEAAVKTANTVLEPLGLSFELPTFDDNGQGRQVLGPLKIKIGGANWLLRPVLGAVLSQQQIIELQGQLFRVLFDPKDCDQLLGLMKNIPEFNAQYNYLGSTAPLLVAATMGVLSGGSATISVGGAAVSIDDTYFPTLNYGAPSFVQTPGVAAVPGEPSQLGAPPRTRALGESSTSTTHGECHTTSPAGAPRCWRGLAPLAAALAGLVALGSLAADEISIRRRARLARNEMQ